MSSAMNYVSSKLTPPPTAPTGTTTTADAINNFVSALIKSGLVYTALTALASWGASAGNPLIATAITAAVSIVSTYLHQRYGDAPTTARMTAR
jgi:hypothetical protein